MPVFTPKVGAIVIVCLVMAVPIPGKTQFLLTPRKEPPEDLILDPAREKQTRALQHFAWGLHIQQRNPASPSAYRHFQKALLQMPHSKYLLRSLTAPLYGQGKYERLVELLTPVAKQNPDAIEVQITLAEAFIALQKPEKAIEILHNARRHFETPSPRIVCELARCHWFRKDYRTAHRLLRKAVKGGGLSENPSVRYCLALNYHRWAQHRTAKPSSPKDDQKKDNKPRPEMPSTSHLRNRAAEEAANAANLIRKKGQLDYTHVRTLGNLLRRYEKWDTLSEFLQRVHNEKLTEWRRTLDAILAESLVRTGQTSKAVRVLNELKNTRGLPLNMLARTARLFREAGKLQSAVSVYKDQILTRAPTNQPVRLTLAELYLRINRPRKAIDAVRSCNDYPVRKYVIKSRAYNSMKKLSQSLEAARNALDKAKETGKTSMLSSQFRLYMANMYIKQEQLSKAIKLAEEAHKISGKSATTANFMGYILANADRELTRAAELIRQAVKAEPQNPAYLDSLAWVAYRQERFNAALKHILHSLHLTKLEPDPVILHHAGDICHANDLKLLARRYWWESLAVGPPHPEKVRGKLRRLRDAR